MTDVELDCLLKLFENGGTKLVEGTGHKKYDDLDAQGYIKRETVRGNMSALFYTLTEKGRSFVEARRGK